MQVQKYILRKFIFLLILVVVFTGIVWESIEIVSNLKNSSHMTWQNISFTLPILRFIKFFPAILPVIFIVTTSSLIISMHRRNELLSLRALGFSVFHLFKPLIYFSFLLSLIYVLIIDPIISHFMHKYQLDLESHTVYSTNKDTGIWFIEKHPDLTSVYKIAYAKPLENQLYDISIFIQNNEYKFIRRIDAQEASYDEKQICMRDAKTTDAKLVTTEQPLYCVDTQINLQKFITNLWRKNTETIFSIVYDIRHLKDKAINISTQRMRLFNLLSLPVYLALAIIICVPIGNIHRKSNLFQAYIYILGSIIIIYIMQAVFNQISLTSDINILYLVILLTLLATVIMIMILLRSHDISLSKKNGFSI